MNERSNFLQLVEDFMNMGLDEDTACRAVFAQFFPEIYDANDYDA